MPNLVNVGNDQRLELISKQALMNRSIVMHAEAISCLAFGIELNQFLPANVL